MSFLSLRIRSGIQTENWNSIPPLVEAQIRMGNHLAGDPSLLRQLVRRAYYSVALLDLERYLNVAGLEVGDLSGISAELTQATEDWPLDRTVEWERVEALEPIYWKSKKLFLAYDFDFADPNLLEDRKPDIWKQTFEQMKVILYRFSGLADLDLLYLLGAYEQIENASSKSLKSISDLTENWASIEPGSDGHRFYYWSEMLLPGWDKFFDRWVETHAKLRAATAAVAVTRYRIDHGGKLPGSLVELVPEYLAEVPLEPRSNKSFELIQTGHGFGIGRGAPLFSVVISEP